MELGHMVSCEYPVKGSRINSKETSAPKELNVLVIREGIVAFVGSSSSEMSTLLRTLNRIYKATADSTYVAQKPWGELYSFDETRNDGSTHSFLESSANKIEQI